MVIRETLKNAISALRESGNDNPVSEAHQIVRYVLDVSAVDLVLMHEKNITKRQQEKISEILSRRKSGEPLQYILGVQEFMSLEFSVEPGVLIPRADTEILVEYIIDHYKDSGFSLLDIGTGTGCIPLSVAHYCPNALVRGIDIEKVPLALSEKNCRALQLSHRAAFLECDILSKTPPGRYDVISSNPPYIESDVIPTLMTEVKDFEPHTALDGGDDGLKFYRRICTLAPKLLNPRGLLIYEIGFNQAERVCRLMKKDFSDIEVLRDLSGNDRVVLGKLKA